MPHAVERAQPRQRQAARVDAGPERDQQRREEGEGGEYGEPDDDGAADAHRRQERSLEEEQGAQSDGDCEAREDDRVSGRVERGDQRVVPARTPLELVPVATDDEQRVVDRHAEADQRGHVDRVHGDVDHVGERGDGRHAGDHGERADADRQRRCGHRAEDGDQHQQRRAAG